MESFIHLRKGTTPWRLHADLDGLKDDELGRGGFTGRTANMYRRHDPTAYRAEGPLRPVDVMSSELKPSDATDVAGGPMLLFSNPDCRFLLSRRSEPMPFFTRHIDGDLLSFVHRGSGVLETEFGPMRYHEGDWIYLPKATTWRQLPDDATTLLMVEATDEFRVPPPGRWGATSRSTHHRSPSQSRSPSTTTGATSTWFGLMHRGRPDNALLPTQSDRRRGLARRQLPVHIQYRRLQRRCLRERAPAADRAPVHAGHRCVCDEFPAQARRDRARHRAPAVVSPQRRLRRGLVLPRRDLFGIAMPPGLISHSPQGVAPRPAGTGTGAGPTQIRRTVPHRVAGHLDRHTPQAHALG